MQVLPVIVPYIQTTSNIAISCRALCMWLSNNGFAIKSSKKRCLENLAFCKLLEHPDLNNWTYRAFEDAIREDDTSKLLLLLRKGADIEAKDDSLKYTALFWAAIMGNTECLKLLLEHNANIEAKSSRGCTVLIYALIHGRIDCVKLLLKHGAKVNPEVRKKYPQYSELWGA